MRRAYNEIGMIKHAEVKEFDHRILSDKAFKVMEQSSFDLYVDDEGTYYMNSNGKDDLTKIGTLEDLNDTIEAYAED